MTKSAPKDLQDRGDSVEEKMYHRIARALHERGSKLHVARGSTDSRQNGEFGDVQISASMTEAPLVLIEVKSSSYPTSFSLSDYEKRCSRAQWFVVDGPMGMWIVPREVVMANLEERGEKSDRYWIARPPMEYWITFDLFISTIRSRLGESWTPSLLGGLFNSKET